MPSPATCKATRRDFHLRTTNILRHAVQLSALGSEPAAQRRGYKEIGQGEVNGMRGRSAELCMQDTSTMWSHGFAGAKNVEKPAHL